VMDNAKCMEQEKTHKEIVGGISHNNYSTIRMLSRGLCPRLQHLDEHSVSTRAQASRTQIAWQSVCRSHGTTYQKIKFSRCSIKNFKRSDFPRGVNVWSETLTVVSQTVV